MLRVRVETYVFVHGVLLGSNRSGGSKRFELFERLERFERVHPTPNSPVISFSYNSVISIRYWTSAAVLV